MGDSGVGRATLPRTHQALPQGLERAPPEELRGHGRKNLWPSQSCQTGRSHTATTMRRRHNRTAFGAKILWEWASARLSYCR